MREYKPLGPKALLAVEKLEQLGPMKVSAVAALTGTSPNSLSASLGRAVHMGYLTVKTGRRREENCNVFAVVSSWREVHKKRLELYKKQPRKDKHVPHAVWTGVSSVFQMGAM